MGRKTDSESCPFLHLTKEGSDGKVEGEALLLQTELLSRERPAGIGSQTRLRIIKLHVGSLIGNQLVVMRSRIQCCDAVMAGIKGGGGGGLGGW